MGKGRGGGELGVEVGGGSVVEEGGNGSFEDLGNGLVGFCWELGDGVGEVEDACLDLWVVGVGSSSTFEGLESEEILL